MPVFVDTPICHPLDFYMAINQKSTRQNLDKIPGFPCLYRHSVNGIYYAIKKFGGKRKEHSLDTTDRKTAERKLKEWINNQDKIDADAAKLTLGELIQKFEDANAGKSEKTKATNTSIINVLKETWKHGMTKPVSELKPSHLNDWLAQHEGRLKNTSYNRYCGFLKQLFEIAVSDRVIAESPFEEVTTPWKKPQKPIRNVPTQEQFEQLVADIRAQKYNDDAEETADFVEFLGSAGLGQAEAGNLTWGDVDFSRKRLAVRRQKTQAVFYVPIYPQLGTLLERRLKGAKEKPTPTTKVFKIKDAKKGLEAACLRLKLKHFTQRNIRQVLIRKLWKAGVDYKLISKWQGHQDGGKLILDTYTEVFGDDDANYENQQLKKLLPQQPTESNNPKQ